jgi:kynurenine 3-monooxygenase
MEHNKKIIITGAGLCGSLLALKMAQRGYEVIVYEKRPDMRSVEISAGRSINLALSDRGIAALTQAGIIEKVKQLMIPMHGRMIHPVEGELTFVKYSGREGEWINSISRGGLNKLLMDEAEATGKVTLKFNMSCESVNFDEGTIHLHNLVTGQKSQDQAEVIFGTDGAGSAIRNAMLENSNRLRFDFSLQYLSTGYKELEIPAGPNGSFRMEKNALHIWPRSGFMMIALPNLDGSFTVTLFMPFEGSSGFDNLKNEQEVLQFFDTYFPTAKYHMDDIINDFNNNPTSSLGTVKCFPWQVNGRFLLMGDAAHAIVPFYGQGMNASFEDVMVLDRLVDEYGGDWKQILPKYQEIRKIDADAIADLAAENEIEMRAATADPVFLLKRKIELHLEQKYPDYFSKYSMVTFREDLPYHFAMEKGRAQDKILMEYAKEIGSFERMDENEVLSRLSVIEADMREG